MDKYYSITIDLLNELMNKNEKYLDINGLEIKTIYNTLLIQGLSTILYPVAFKYLSYRGNLNLLTNWTSNVKKIALLNLVISQQIGVVINAFKEKNIYPIILKGLSISRLYKNPEYRSMSDLDILVPEFEWEKSKSLLIAEGFLQVEDEDYHPLHVKFSKQNSIVVELHRRLIHSGYLGIRNEDNWHKHIWNNKQKLNFINIEFFGMSNEDELINQIVHFASHFIFVGAKVKHLFEMALIINSAKKLDWSYIEIMLKSLEFDRFASLLFSICRTYFHADVPINNFKESNQNQLNFINDLFKYFSIEKKAGDFKGWRNIVGQYKYIIKNPILQPLAIVIEGSSQYHLNGLFKLPLIINNVIRNVRMINKKIRIIRRYKLMKLIS